MQSSRDNHHRMFKERGSVCRKSGRRVVGCSSPTRNDVVWCKQSQASRVGGQCSDRFDPSPGPLYSGASGHHYSQWSPGHFENHHMSKSPSRVIRVRHRIKRRTTSLSLKAGARFYSLIFSLQLTIFSSEPVRHQLGICLLPDCQIHLCMVS